MKFINKLSIRNKLLSVILLVSIFSLIVGFTTVIMFDIRTFREDLAENMVTTTKIIGDFSLVDLVFRDQNASRKTLSILAGIPTVEAAFLYDADGRLFSSYLKNAQPSAAPDVEYASAKFEGGFLHVFQPIRDQGKDIGTMYLKVSTQQLQSKVRNYVLTMIALAIGLMAVSLLVAALLQRFISRPILHLAATAREISEKEDYSIRVQSKSEDEIGTLSDGFNKMLTQIQKRQEERDRAEAALRESEDRYRGLVESSPETILVEQNGRLVYLNPAGLKMLGYDSIDGLRGLGLADLLFVPSDGRESIESEQVTPREVQFKTRQGKFVDVEVSFIQILYKGKIAIQGIVRDVTEQKMLQQSAQRNERLAAIGEFSAVIAHEMRNSLGSISLNFRFLADKLTVPEAYKQNFQNIERSMYRIQEVIKDILTFSRPAPPVFRKHHIEKVLDSSILTVERELENANVELNKNYASGLQEVSVDANQISLVFVNLFLNAVQSMPAGGILSVHTRLDSDRVLVIIEDTGKGIPIEIIDKIFNPFFTTRPEGVGLGLAIVSRTIEQHGAKISVTSEPGKGTSFTIEFPVAK